MSHTHTHAFFWLGRLQSPLAQDLLASLLHDGREGWWCGEAAFLAEEAGEMEMPQKRLQDALPTLQPTAQHRLHLLENKDEGSFAPLFFWELALPPAGDLFQQPPILWDRLFGAWAAAMRTLQRWLQALPHDQEGTILLLWPKLDAATLSPWQTLMQSWQQSLCSFLQSDLKERMIRLHHLPTHLSLERARIEMQRILPLHFPAPSAPREKSDPERSRYEAISAMKKTLRDLKIPLLALAQQIDKSPFFVRKQLHQRFEKLSGLSFSDWLAILHRHTDGWAHLLSSREAHLLLPMMRDRLKAAKELAKMLRDIKETLQHFPQSPADPPHPALRELSSERDALLLAVRRYLDAFHALQENQERTPAPSL
jgi:hypothetical protein